MPWYQQPVRVSDASFVGIGGLPLSQNIPLGSGVLAAALAAGAADDAAGAALAVAVGVATGVVSVAFECPQAQIKNAKTTERTERMPPP